MNHIMLAITALFAVSLNAFSQTSKKSNTTAEENNASKKSLVVYFSATGTTKRAAEILAKEAGADLFEITPEVAYTNADLDWRNQQSRSSVEMKNLKVRPAIKNGKVENISQYDTVFVGFPIWWYTAPTIINTWIEGNDLKGKTIVVFATSGGSSTKKATKDLRETYPEYIFKDGGLLNGRSKVEAQALLKKLK